MRPFLLGSLPQNRLLVPCGRHRVEIPTVRMSHAAAAVQAELSEYLNAKGINALFVAITGTIHRLRAAPRLSDCQATAASIYSSSFDPHHTITPRPEGLLIEKPDNPIAFTIEFLCKVYVSDK